MTFTNLDIRRDGKADLCSPQTEDEVIVSFSGPFSWFCNLDAPSMYDAAESLKAGIYLWTVPLMNGHLTYYVGETGRSFGTRLREHYEELVAARYHVYSAQEFARGEKIVVWPGRYDSVDRKTDVDCESNRLRLSEPIRDMAHVLRFFLAPLSCDTRTRLRIEAAIANSLYDAAGVAGSFQDRIRYRPRTNNEQPINCRLSSSVPLLGLTERFLA